MISATAPWLGQVFDEVLEKKQRQDDSDSGRDSGKKKGLGVDIEVEGNGNEGGVDINVGLEGEYRGLCEGAHWVEGEGWKVRGGG